jgi:putative ABC transport system permease protein
VAFAMMLLSGAGLLVRSMHNLLTVSPGFDAQNILHFTVRTPQARYPQNEQVWNFHQTLLEHLKKIHGVQSAAAANLLPLTGEDWSFSFDIKGRELPEEDQPSAEYRVVSSEYFRTMRIPLRDGRPFSNQDRMNSQPVAIINEAFAKRFFPSENPIGQQLRIGDSVKDYRQIVGICANVKDFGLASESVPVLYVSISQRPLRYMNYIVRTSRDAGTIAPDVRKVVHSLDSEMPLFETGTMQSTLMGSVNRRRFTTFVLAFLASSALGLALLGIYGLLSYSVTQRTREIGLRMAMGARQSAIIRLILNSGLKLVTAGILLGLIGAFPTTRLLSSLLFGVAPDDSPTLIAVIVAFLFVALFAILLPAKRAAKIEPLQALRYE